MSPGWLLVLALAGDPPAQAAPEAASQPAAAPAPLPAYPLGPLPMPDFLAPGDPLTLTDLRYSMRDSGRAEHAFGARVRYGRMGYLGVEFDGERQGLRLETHRLSLAASTENGSWALDAGWRARRFLVWAEARQAGEGADRGIVLGPTAHLRLTSDVEIHGWVNGDTARPSGRFLTAAGVGAAWRRAAWLEAFGAYTRSHAVTDAGSENRLDVGRLSLIAQLGRVEALVEGSLEDVKGRFPRRESDAHGRLRLPLAPRLLVEGGARGRFDWEADVQRHEYGGALTWFGRRFTLPRAGSAARRAVDLARRATERGEYELRAFDDGALREQRERLALSPHAVDLREDLEAAYRAQVEERPVPLLGIEVLHRDDSFAGESAVAMRALVGVPWPPAWPWRSGETSVPFLRLDLEHERTTTATSFRSSADRASLTFSLSREVDLVLRVSRTEPTALDVVRGIGVVRAFSFSSVYARGR
jgi:hypothetical protein